MADERLAAISNLRVISADFASGRMSFEEFLARTGKQFAPFDPLHWTTKDLPVEVRMEVEFYSKWHGGEFGEFDDVFPRAAGWVYGESREPYGWVDKEKYRQMFAEAFNALELSLLA